MNCSACGLVIDDDSFFCDQCGEEVKICPQCGLSGAKMRCRHDGSLLVSAKDLRSEQDSQSATGAVSDESPAPVLTLINTTISLHYQPQDGDILGRRAGPLSSTLSQHGGVSGRHAEIHFSPDAGWTVTDQQSTNGTTYDGQALTPMKAVPLRDGGSLVLGKSVELYTRIEKPTPTVVEGQ